MKNEPTPILRSKLLLVEGKDEVNLFDKLLGDMQLLNQIQVIPVGGVTYFLRNLKGLKNASGYESVTSIGIIRDADDETSDPAFASICTALKNAALPQPERQLQMTDTEPRIGVLILQRMLETLCYESVKNAPAYFCVEQYVTCLNDRQIQLTDQNLPKTRVRAFLASREWFEIAYFEQLQKMATSQTLAPPQSVTVDLVKAHAFLASRYKPNLDLGEAAQKGYWQLDHAVFKPVRDFLQML